MMNGENGNYVGLSEVGACIWELIEAPRTFDSLCGALVGEFAVSQELRRTEVRTFLGDLAAHDAISLDRPPTA